MATAEPILFILTNPNDSRCQRERQIAEGRKHSTNVSYARRRKLSDAHQLRRKDARKRQLTFKIDLPSLNTIMHPPSIHPDWHIEEKRGMHYYLQVTAPGMLPYTHGSFFNIITPCLAIHDVGIRNILLAIVAMQLSPSSPSADPALNYEAVIRCNSAVQHFRHRLHCLPRNIVQASCILFACVQILQLRIEAARAYIHTALAFSPELTNSIWSNRSATARQSHRSISDSRAMSSFQEQAITSTIVESVALFQLSFPGGTDFQNTKQCLELSSDALRGPVNDGYDFSAGIERFYLICQQIARNLTYQSYVDRRTLLARDILTRLDDFQMYLYSIRPTEQGARAKYRYDLLVSAEKMLRIMAHCRVLGAHQLDYDDYNEQFQELIRSVECSLDEMSPPTPFIFLPFVHLTIKPLWWTAVYCREPGLRRRAIALLKCQRRNEVGLDNWVTYNVATTIMKLEEGSRAVHIASDIPEYARIVLRGFELDKAGEFCMLYSFSHTTDNACRGLKEILHFEPDPAKILPMLDPPSILENLNSLQRIVAQHDITEYPAGFVLPMLYDGNPVSVTLIVNQNSQS